MVSRPSWYGGNIDLEYFDFCPRLRLLHEFFENTSKFITRHRLCDLRLCEFLNSYSIRGKELGLYMHFFDPGHWMYFYANAFPSDEEWVAAIEDDQPQDSDLKPGHVGVKGGHVSTQVPITDIDITLANSACAEFKYWDEPMTEAKLARYLAYFRYYIEVGLVRSPGAPCDWNPSHPNYLAARVGCGTPCPPTTAILHHLVTKPLTF